MNKIFYGLTLALALCLGGAAMAKHDGTNHNMSGGAYSQNSAPTSASSVQAVLMMPDETVVMLQGNIAKKVGEETYVFSDGTGEVMVEIDSNVWNGQNVSPTDMVTIIGEIDQEGNATVVEVEQLMLAPQASLQQ